MDDPVLLRKLVKLRESFERLPETGLVSVEQATQMANIARVRNRLLHRYDEVSDGEFLDTARIALTVFPQYMAAVFRRAHSEDGTDDGE